MPTRLAAALDAVFDRTCEDLARLVAVPSVSVGGAHAADVAASAQLTAALFADAGADEVRVLAAGGGPAVCARWEAPAGAPTMLLYAHHDVQPAGDESAWSTPPFTAVERDGRLYGRGAADNKAGVAVHLAALRALGGRPPVGVVVLVEGEEEIGSPTLEPLLDEHAALLRADAAVVADAASLRVGQPALTVSLRGLVDCVVELRTLTTPLHSGVFGGVVPDAVAALARLVASLYDDDGAVVVPGLDGAVPVGLALEGDELLRNAAAVAGLSLMDARDAAARAWTRPALAVLGLDAPAVAGAGNQLTPATRAKLSLRLPPGVDAAAAYGRLVSHLAGHVPWGAELAVTPGQSVDPVAVDTRDPVFALAERCFADAWGTEPIRIGSGGSIPAAAALARRLPRAPIVLFGAADRTSRTHGPDESVDLGELRRSALAEALLLRRMV